MFETLLKLHITVSIICFIIYFIGIFAMLNNIKERYDLSPLNKNRFEIILTIIKMIVIFLFPVINIIFALIMIFMYDEILKISESRLRESKFIKLKTDTVN